MRNVAFTCNAKIVVAECSRWRNWFCDNVTKVNYKVQLRFLILLCYSDTIPLIIYMLLYTLT